MNRGTLAPFQIACGTAPREREGKECFLIHGIVDALGDVPQCVQLQVSVHGEP